MGSSRVYAVDTEVSAKYVFSYVIVRLELARILLETCTVPRTRYSKHVFPSDSVYPRF